MNSQKTIAERLIAKRPATAQNKEVEALSPTLMLVLSQWF
ncbi:MAG: hypothetical protein CM15mP83_7650 [Flavobacteriaceae bacterium]|nr:MAG: hypothetical protein CM15mP83_7650 [Flavobacteriaceae bacterium]